MSLKIPKVLVITGPTSTGKTQVSYELARKQKGEVINGDKFFFYKEFEVGTGIQDSLENTDVKQHLYQILHPTDNVPDATEYIRTSTEIINSMDTKNRFAVMEVYPFSYIKKLAENNTEFKPAIIGLRPTSHINFKEKVEQRLGALIEEGLVTETEEMLDKDYRNTYVMQNSFVYGPIIEYLDGVLSLDQAKDKIVSLFLEREQEASSKFQTIPGIKWIAHDKSKLPTTIRKILNWV